MEGWLEGRKDGWTKGLMMDGQKKDGGRMRDGWMLDEGWMDKGMDDGWTKLRMVG